MNLGFLFHILILYVQAPLTISPEPSCSNKIYCQGRLLHVVQMSKPFEDSKQFVDMMMRYDSATIHKHFEQLYQSSYGKIPRKHIQKFVEENFSKEDEMDIWHGGDYTANPEVLSRITVRKYLRFARSLVPIWATLGRKIKDHVEKNISRYSIIPVPNGFIVPGGRFREFYYWDSYWIIIGLLHSEMVNSVRSMLENFLWLVEKYGFIPNGGRIYYLNRSQPPLLLLMIKEYIKVTKDTNWLKKNLPTMEKELDFWLKNKSITISFNNKRYTLARYNVESSTPRPESYSEDYRTCSSLKSSAHRKKCYREIKTGAESGWDFSSRWMTGRRNLSDMIISRIIPVDLNSFLAESFRTISDFYRIVGNDNKRKRWFDIHQTWKNDLHELLYNKKAGIWYDFNTISMKQNENFYPSNFAPLWVNLFNGEEIAKEFGYKAVKYLVSNKIHMYDGGIPTSLLETGEQWDMPNAWPPLQSIIILGLQRSGHKTAKQYAKRLAERWLDVNFALFDSSMVMYEKYDAEFPGKAGSGGEYEVQSGFGWSNGVVLELIEEFFTIKKKRVRSSGTWLSVIDIRSSAIISLLQLRIIV